MLNPTTQHNLVTLNSGNLKVLNALWQLRYVSKHSIAVKNYYLPYSAASAKVCAFIEFIVDLMSSLVIPLWGQR